MPKKKGDDKREEAYRDSKTGSDKTVRDGTIKATRSGERHKETGKHSETLREGGPDNTRGAERITKKPGTHCGGPRRTE